MRKQHRLESFAARHRRSGATLVESAIVLNSVLAIMIGIVDLGLGVMNYNTMSEASRRLARSAIVRGEHATPAHSIWGPAGFEGNCADGSPPAAAVLPLLVAVDPQDVELELEWPDGGNDVNDRVVATVRYEYQPILPALWGGGTYLLTATSTMRIAH